MNVQRILCPVDFSKFNQAANEYASMLATANDAQIIYFHAYLPDVLYAKPELFDHDLHQQRLLQEMEENYSPVNDQIKASYVVEFGTPADQIVNYAAEHDIDMIVIGTHGRTGLRRVILGSVAEAVVRRAECPVLAIKTESKVMQET